MKNGILSMQRIYNYGSWLQAYALKRIVESIAPDSVQFVDYHAEKPVTAHGKKHIKYLTKKSKNALGELLTSKRIFSKILKNEGLAHVYRFKHEYQRQLFGNKGLRKNYTPELDNLIIGSDEVFNCLQDNPRVGYSKELFGANSRAKKVVSYAASFGNTTLEKIKQYSKESEIASWLGNLKDISVRDKNSYNVVKALTGREAEIHLDPVLAYDFASEWKKEHHAEEMQGKYLIVYTYANRLTQLEIKSISEYASKHGLRIVGINAYYDFFDEWVHDHPLNVLQWFRGAECIVTDTFHGTIFSVITHKKFATFIRKSKNGSYGNHEKLYDLLERIALTDRIVNNPEEVGKILDEEIDYSETEEIIRRERAHTYEYIRRVLDEDI